MDSTFRKHIVISAVNIRKGGTLTILRDCIRYLSTCKECEVTALVHDRSLCDFPNINYIEIPWSIKGWGRRLWCEYVTMYHLSKQLQPIHLWFSLHDTTPRVKSMKQVVYCHTSFPFMKPKWQDMLMDIKIPLFSLFTKYAYKTNISKNEFLVVQQEWIRKGLSGITGFPAERIIVAPPQIEMPSLKGGCSDEDKPVFLYPSTPDCHKNFETLCRAAQLLENRIGKGKFTVVITVSGKENRYAKWLKRKFGAIESVDFHGFMPKEELFRYYGKAVCLVFPSRVETWGLPISEFKQSGKPMILADMPYALESASGAERVALFPCYDSFFLAELMQEVLMGTLSSFESIPDKAINRPYAIGWASLFKQII